MGTKLRVGERVKVTHRIDLYPYAVLDAGEQGEVVEVEDVFGSPAVNVRMEVIHKGLTEWDNCALLVPPESSYIAPLRVAYHKMVAAVIGGGGVAGYLVKAHVIHCAWRIAAATVTAYVAG